MALLPSYTAPPAISWIASYWADDPLTGGGAVGGATQQAIQSTDHNPAHALTVGTNLPQHIRYDPQMNNRGSWLTALNGALYRAVSASEKAATGQSFSVVIVAALPDLSTWAANGTGVGLIATGASVGALGNVGAGYGDGNYYTFSRVGGGNNNYFNRRAITGTPTLLVYRVNAGGGSGPRIRVNGETYGPGPYSDATAVLDYIGLGTGGGLNPYRVGFLGYYKGDITADGNWGAFQDWVQSHYGFDPRATYDSTKPPPISWRAEYLADDFDASTGTWPDRTGRGYALALPIGANANVPGIVAASGNIPAGWRCGYDGGSVGKTPQITPAPALCRYGSRDLEFIARITSSGTTLNMASVCSGFYGSRQWEWTAVAGGTIAFTWNDVANGNGVATSVSFPADLANKPIWLRLTQVISGGQTTHTYYVSTADTSSPPTTWTQLGVPQTVAYAANFADQNSPLNFGASGPWGLPATPGQMLHRFIINNGIGGPAIVDADFAAQAPGTTTSFTDGAGNTVTLAQTLPLKVNNVLNGKPVVRFDGVDDYLTAVLGSAAVPFSVVCLVKWRTYSGSAQSVVTGTVPASNWYVANGNTNVDRWMFNNSTMQYVDGTGKLCTDWHLVRAYFNGTSSYLYLDEVAVMSNVPTGGSPLATITLGGGPVDIPYLAFYWGDVSTSALWSAWKNWANTYYGLSLP